MSRKEIMCSDFLIVCSGLFDIQKNKYKSETARGLYMTVCIYMQKASNEVLMYAVSVSPVDLALQSHPSEVTVGPIDTSDCQWNIGRFTGDTCSAAPRGPRMRPDPRAQKSAGLSEVIIPLPRCRRLKYCMVMQLHVLLFNFYSCLLWQMSELEFECLGMRKWFSMRSCAELFKGQYHEISLSLCRMWKVQQYKRQRGSRRGFYVSKWFMFDKETHNTENINSSQCSQKQVCYW